MPEWFERYDHIYWLDLDYSKILRINNEQKFRKFEETYLERTPNSSYPLINWGRVTQDYSGIEIIPYQWEFRMGSDWYYPWDVASGCIWDGSTIKGFKEIVVN